MLSSSSPCKLFVNFNFKTFPRILESTRKMNTNASRVQQPKWHDPELDNNKDSSIFYGRPPLKLYNSLVRRNVKFAPRKGSLVTWYCCGPTVYDYSHLGHARNYVTTDILRRIMRLHFGFEIMFVQNVTDIDDKIIVKARAMYITQQLEKQYENFGKVPEDLIEKVQKALDWYISKHLKPDAQDPDELAKQQMHQKNIDRTKEALKLILTKGEEKEYTTKLFLENTNSVLVPYLDKLECFGEITDIGVYSELSTKWEREFDKDMTELGVIPPGFTTRVSEYVPEIVQFISKLVDKNYAYCLADGSVYFDIEAFESNPKHVYAKLQPWNRSNLALLNEGEGSLSSSQQQQQQQSTKLEQKKSSSDFALWKASRRGEPSWPSPWGAGRPGWHIECSVMASCVLGSPIDIHSGGIDLCFPHHDNELAQSEAYHDCEQWTDYFLHVGHLHIEGQKMSKSLKNFITIQDALKTVTANQLRLCFLYQQWNKPMDYKHDLVEHVSRIEKFFNNFLLAVASFKKPEIIYGPSQETDDERQQSYKLADSLRTQILEFNEALSDNFDTPRAMRSIEELVSQTNKYLQSMPSSHYKLSLLEEISRWVQEKLELFGLETNATKKYNGNSMKTGEESIEQPLLDLIASFREKVRTTCKTPSIDMKELKNTLLTLCDQVRDNDLLDIGIYLEDRRDAAPLVKKLDSKDKQELIEKRDLIQLEKNEKRETKLKQKNLQISGSSSKGGREEKEKNSQSFDSLKDYLVSMNAQHKFASFDDAGVPTHIFKEKEGEGKDDNGKENTEPISKSMSKKLAKQVEKYHAMVEKSKKI